MNTEDRLWRLFLLTDTQALHNPNVSPSKVAAADYDPIVAVSKNKWSGPQHYFGCITMLTTAVLKLYAELDLFRFEQIAKHTSSVDREHFGIQTMADGRSQVYQKA
jgi:hypothetical protein